MKNLIQDRKGTALLIALLVMGVLIAVSLVLSSLIFREVRITRDVIDAGKAYYAAESGIEIALLELDNNLPGWGTEQGDDGSFKYQALKLDENLETVGEYRVNNSCNAYPCFDEDLDKTLAPIAAYYNYLDLNDSVTIPLFVVKDGEEVPVTDFTVEFYAAFNLEDLNLKEAGHNLAGWDILRWKLFGLHGPIGTTGATETISDFTAVSTYLQDQENLNIDNFESGKIPNFGNIATNPSWFGSVSCNEKNEQRDTTGISCSPYQDPQFQAADFENTLQSGYESGIIVGQCSNTQAREVYVYGGDGEIDGIYPCYEIGDFLGTHHLNYLILTNLMNPAVLKEDFSPKQKEILSRLYYRIEVYGDEKVVREYANVQANGYSGNMKQSIDVKIKRGSFMPVFNFTLYSTYKKDGKCSDFYDDCPDTP